MVIACLDGSSNLPGSTQKATLRGFFRFAYGRLTNDRSQAPNSKVFYWDLEFEFWNLPEGIVGLELRRSPNRVR